MTATEPLPSSPRSADARERALCDTVAANVSRLRRNSGMDHDALAVLSGLTSEQVRAVENGTAVLRLRMLWALADAFEVPFGVLLAGAPCTFTSFHVRRAADSETVASSADGFRTRPLSAAGDPREPEVYEVTIAPGWREEAAPHALDTFEHLVVIRGTLTVRAGDRTATLGPGDAVFFRADQPHEYWNQGISETVAHLTMTYAGDWSDTAME